ncbi:TonB-dependent receptor plug domain-containing protein [Muricauda sp. CAU 1633]|uniref:M56 family metallopeptidase n=1 Tax=Allomuricauda sp. CAU 1633 TaxID=2816036 RepID=UPI001A9016A7|nr:M56 family metallopeptidase [Muricauda sp. CAU 1633]MBO0321922.1 TonB-dependent receptor plug domain-containing protein [Muricauda sp. CAU 1633]
MEDFLLYILRSAGISTLFWFCYVVFLKKETFFNANRVFLLSGLVLSFLIPLVSIKEIVWIEPIMLPFNSGTSQLETGTDNVSTVHWMAILFIVYGLGAAFLFIRLIINLLSLKRIVAKGDCQKEGGINLVETQKNTTPFSFFNYLIYNPETLTKSDFDTIVTHERVHIKGLHTLDILLIHTVILLQWFNPFIWLYKSNVEHNLEFIADRGALQSGRDRIGYQNLMLKTVVDATHPYFSNSFYNSIIKKRIVMLNKQKSKKSRVWKFGIVLPFLVGFILSFQTTTIAQVKQVKIVDYASDNSQLQDSYSIKKNSTDAEIAEIKNSIEQKGGSFTHSLKRNTKGDIVALEFKIVNHGTGQFTSTVPFSQCYFGTLKGGGVFVADNKEDYDGMNNLSVDSRAPTSQKRTVSISPRNSSQEKPLVVIDGIIKKDANIDNLEIAPGEIKNINVLKDEMATEKYGTKGKNGVVEVTTKKFKGGSNNSVAIRSSSGDKPLIVIDGKEHPNANINDLGLEPEEIESMNVLKDESAEKKYGRKGINGVIEITTKKKN